MKKIFKKVIVFAVIFVIAFLLSNINKKMPIYDKKADTSNYGNMGELVAGLTVTQEFTCKKPVLDGVSIMVATYGRALTCQYEYQIIDVNTKEVLREGTVNASEFKDSKYYTINFDQIKGCKGQRLIFSISNLDGGAGNAATIYNVPKGGENASLHLNEDDFPNNTLALRTVSHMFDVETFITIAFCLAYLYIFILILFRFFS